MMSFLAQAVDSEPARGAIAQAFHEGGVWMYPILFVLILVVMVALERTYVLYFKVSARREEFVANLRQHILSQNLNRAIEFATQDPTPLGRIIEAGLLKANHDDEVVQSAMDEAALREIPKLEARTGYLPMFSNVATLMGLLGTIIGLIRSFGAVAMADAATKSTELSQGISEAMNCTAFGLIVAIPALFLYAILQSRTQRLIEDINAASVNIINLVILNREQLGLAPSSKEH